MDKTTAGRYARQLHLAETGELKTEPARQSLEAINPARVGRLLLFDDRRIVGRKQLTHCLLVFCAVVSWFLRGDSGRMNPIPPYAAKGSHESGKRFLETFRNVLIKWIFMENCKHSEGFITAYGSPKYS